MIMPRIVFIILLSLQLDPAFGQAAPDPPASMTSFVKLHLSTGSYFYQSGDKVHFTLLVLHPATLDAIRFRHTVDLTVTDSRGQSILTRKYYADNGIISDLLDPRLFSTGGTYTLLTGVTFNGNKFTASRRIVIQSIIRNNFLFSAKPDREQYRAGDSMKVSFLLRQANGLPVKLTSFEVSEQYLSAVHKTHMLTTDMEGRAELRTTIDKNYTVNDLMISAHVQFQGQGFTSTERISLTTGNTTIRAFFEDGTFNPDISNTVVFINSNEYGEMVSNRFWIIHGENNDSSMVESDAFGLCRHVFPKGTPLAGLRIRTMEGRILLLDLTAVKPADLVMTVTGKTADKVYYAVYSGIDRKIMILSHVRGVRAEKRYENLVQGWNKFETDISGLQQGVLQTLLLDTTYNVLAEKLNYVNSHKKLHFKLDQYRLYSNKNQEIRISVSDHLGKPVKGTFALAITDESIFVTLKDRQSKIAENLFFESELDYPVADIGKLFEQGTDSVRDIFLACCSIRHNYWKQVLLDENDKKSVFCYQFMLAKTRYNGKYELRDVKKAVFISERGKYTAEVGKDFSILVPTDRITFPATCTIKYGATKESRPVQNSDANIVMLKDSMLVAHSGKEGKTVVLKDAVKVCMQVVDLPKKTLNTNDVNKQGDRSMAITSRMAGVVISGHSNLSLSSCMSVTRSHSSSAYRSYSINLPDKAGIKSITRLASLASGVTGVATGISGRGARVDGTAYFIDGVRVLNSSMGQERMEKLALTPPLVTAGIPFMNDMQGGVGQSYSYYNYYRSTAYREYNFIFIADQPSRTYASSYGFDRRREEAETPGSYYYFSHFSTDVNGNGTVYVHTPDNAMTWHVNIQGTAAGECGHLDSGISIIKPVYMLVKAPLVMMMHDMAKIEVKIVNESETPIKGMLRNVTNPALTRAIPEIAPHSSYLYTEEITFRELYHELQYELSTTNAGRQEIERHIRVIENIYKKDESYTINNSCERTLVLTKGNKRQSLEIRTKKPFDKSMASYLESMIQEPYGCFEQVSSTNYPNILAYRYILNAGGAKAEGTLSRQREYLLSGYRKLVNYETLTGGFSWYGTGPGNEALSAMGLLQFLKLGECGISIDNVMARRVKRWLMNKKDRFGRFHQSEGKYGFANMSADVAHAYITYALLETGERELENSIELIGQNIVESRNLYNISLLTAIQISRNDTSYRTYLQELKSAFENIRKPKTESSYIVRSVVNSSRVGAINETFAITAISIFKNKLDTELGFARQICEYFMMQDIHSWGSMQSKAFVLEALSYYYTKKSSTELPYKLKFTVNAHSSEVTINPGKENSVILSEYLLEGRNNVRLEFEGEQDLELNFVQVNLLPFDRNAGTDISVNAEFSSRVYKQSDLAYYRIRVRNTSSEIQPQTVAILSIPTGMTINPEELQFLTKQKLCDFYEIRDNRIFLYWEEMNSNEDIRFEMPFICEVAGTYTIAACSVYKYYQPEKKSYYLPAAVAIE
jgi:hypothetical protein